MQSPEASLAFSLNLSHGGLRRRERGLCANEAELVVRCESDPITIGGVASPTRDRRNFSPA